MAMNPTERRLLTRSPATNISRQRVNKMDDDTNAVILANGEVRVWVEQEAVHIKAVDRCGDPVELSDGEVKRLAEALLGFYAKLRG